MRSQVRQLLKSLPVDRVYRETLQLPLIDADVRVALRSRLASLRLPTLGLQASTCRIWPHGHAADYKATQEQYSYSCKEYSSLV